MSLFSLLGALEIGLIFSLVSLGVLLSFRILNFPDLTVDGSFPLGGAIAAILISIGIHPLMATLAAVMGGALAGAVTALLNIHLKIMNLLASILVMIALYSVNLRVMGSPNIPIINDPTLFTLFQIDAISDYIFRPLLLFVIVLFVKLLLDGFFSSQLGLAMRATGENPRMACAQGITVNTMVWCGIALSNALVALAGALFAQSQGSADISMGTGMIVIGLASVIIGETIMPARHIFWITLSVIIGAILYRFFISVALNTELFGLKAQDLNLLTALLVTAVLVLPATKRKLFSHIQRKK